MCAEDGFAKSLTLALKAVLHVTEQVKALKAVVDRELPGMFNGDVRVGSSSTLRLAWDAGKAVCTGMSWTYPVSRRGGAGRPRQLGVLWFWVRLASPKVTSSSLDDNNCPFIVVEVVNESDGLDWSIDDYDCPASWAENDEVLRLDDIDFNLPVMAAGKSIDGDSVWWAGFAHRLGVLSESRLVGECLLPQVVALTNLLRG